MKGIGAESTGEATGDKAVATTGVAMTTAARCMAKDGVHASRAREYGRKNKNRIGTTPDLRVPTKKLSAAEVR